MSARLFDNGKQTKSSENEKLTTNVSVPEAIRSEVNFLILPFFALWDKDVRRKTRTEYKTVTRRDGQRLEISWIVSSNPEFGYPGPFDRMVHKAIEQIISGLPLPIENPLPLGSLYNLCKKMGIQKLGGSQYKKVKEALTRIIATTIISKGAFYSKEKEGWIEDVFHLYDRVVFKGEKMRDDDLADTNYLFLNSWYLDNINNRYTKPIDWTYYKFLKTPIAQRLYELLSVKFYGVLMAKGNSISYRYSTLCGLLPVARQKYLSDAKKLLDPSHEKLKDTGFLRDWSWEDVSQKGEDNEWLIRYHPGRRAKDEIESFNIGEQLEFELPSPGENKSLEGRREMSVQETSIIENLEQRGITSGTARELVASYPIEQIQKQIEVFDWLKETRSQRVGNNAPGFLRKAIEENYQPPDEYVKHLDRQTKQQETDNRKERWLQHREKLIQQDISKWDTITPKERVQAILDAWIFTHGRPNQDEVDSMQQELIDNLPKTDEEKREYIARNHTEDPPSDFE